MSNGFTEEFDIAALRDRLRKMTDEKLVRFGRAARYTCRPYANMGQKPREESVIQLKESRAEFRRRNQLRDSKNN